MSRLSFSFFQYSVRIIRALTILLTLLVGVPLLVLVRYSVNVCYKIKQWVAAFTSSIRLKR